MSKDKNNTAVVEVKDVLIDVSGLDFLVERVTEERVVGQPDDTRAPSPDTEILPPDPPQEPQRD